MVGTGFLQKSSGESFDLQERSAEASADNQLAVQNGTRIAHQTVKATIEQAGTKKALKTAMDHVDKGTVSVDQCLAVLLEDPGIFRIIVTGVPSSYATSSDVVGFLHKLRKTLERLVRDEVQGITKLRRYSDTTPAKLNLRAAGVGGTQGVLGK